MHLFQLSKRRRGEIQDILFSYETVHFDILIVYFPVRLYICVPDHAFT
jgi:hypothetical protein